MANSNPVGFQFLYMVNGYFVPGYITKFKDRKINKRGEVINLVVGKIYAFKF